MCFVCWLYLARWYFCTSWAVAVCVLLEYFKYSSTWVVQMQEELDREGEGIRQSVFG